MIFYGDVIANHKKLVEENKRLKALVEENKRKYEQWKMLSEMFEEEYEKAKKKYNVTPEKEKELKKLLHQRSQKSTEQ